MRQVDDAVVPGGEAVAEQQGSYIYCVAAAGEKANLGTIGIEGKNVYTIPYCDVCAVAHACPAQPYQSSDREVVNSWVIAHQKVIEAACERWDTVLPLGFDTIIKRETGCSAEENVVSWLKGEYDSLRRKIEKVRGKAEFGVQVFWNPRGIAQDLMETNPEIRKLDEEVRTRSKGLAYLYRQRLENLIRREMEAKAEECFRDFFNRIRQHADDIRVEKTKAAEQGLQMIMNLSCLVCRDRHAELGEELGKINCQEGFSVRFTGPWPCYSFVQGL